MNRNVSFKLQNKYSKPKILCTGDFQGQLIFLIYVKRISDIIVKFSVKYQIYADNIMIYTSYNNLSLVNKNDNSLSMCANAIQIWLINITLLLIK